MTDAPTPHRAASAEERDQLRIRLACAICEAHSENPHGRLALIRLRAPYLNWQAKLPIADYLLDTFLAPLLDRITAAEAVNATLYEQHQSLGREWIVERDRANAAEARAAEAEALNRSFAEAHIVISETAQAEEVRANAATADRDRLATELAEAGADAETVSSLAGKLEADRDRLADEVVLLRGALDQIAKPILHMQREMPEGYQFDGHVALTLITPDYLQGIAARALTATGGPTDGQA